MAGEMDAGIIDLPQAVKRRKRKVRTAPKLKSVRKIGHLYSDLKSIGMFNELNIGPIKINSRNMKKLWMTALCFCQKI